VQVKTRIEEFKLFKNPGIGGRSQRAAWATALMLSVSYLTAATRYVDGPTGCPDETGDRDCLSSRGPFRTVGRAVRQFGATLPGDTLMIRGGFYPEPIVLNKPMEIHAYNGAVTIGPSSLLPFDLVADRLDDNALPRNPKWGAQIPNPSNLPDPSQCPRNSCLVHNPGWYPCTGQFTEIDESGCSDCDFHVNWFAVTDEGTAVWEGHSCPAEDDDYNMNLQSINGGGYLKGSELHLHCEFDSDETIDHFTTPWWTRFHRAVDACPCELEGFPTPDCPGAQQMINASQGAFTIMTGLMGLDMAHNSPELHPVWALAMNVEPRFQDDLWVFFVRNWGNEGECGHNQHFLELPNNRYTVRLPWKLGATSVTIDRARQSWHQWLDNGQTSYPDPTVTVVTNQAVLVTFQLDPPRDQGSLWDGELHLNWSM
jgi:hypothetical protein